MEVIEPVGMRVLVRKDDDREITKGGILLPSDTKIPVLTARIVAISAQVDRDPDYPLKPYDKVLVQSDHVTPVEFEPGNKLFIVPVGDIVAVFTSDSYEPAEQEHA